MSMMSYDDGPRFKVVGITAGEYQTDAGNNPVRGRLVHYALEDGTQDTVFVPDSQWSVGNASTVIWAAVKETHGIRNLGNLP